MRVLSLIASGTEIVVELGGEGLLVGRSHLCDFPAAVRALPEVTKPASPTDGDLEQVDPAMKIEAFDALSIYEVDRVKLTELKPDLILTQTQCEICAVTLQDVERTVTDHTGTAAKIVSLRPNSLAEIFDDIRRVGRALGREAQGDCYAAELRGKVSSVRRMTKRILGAAPAPRVAIIERIDPLMAAGTWMPELVALASAENLFGEAGKLSPRMTMEQLVEKDPDFLIIAPSGFDLDRTKKELHLITDHPKFRRLRAFCEGQVAIADGSQYFNRPGPRTYETLQILTEILYPGALDFERKPLENGSKGWEWVPAPEVPARDSAR